MKPLTDEPGGVVEFDPSKVGPPIKAEASPPYMTPEEACNRVWGSGEVASYMRAFGPPAPGRVIQVA